MFKCNHETWCNDEMGYIESGVYSVNMANDGSAKTNTMVLSPRKTVCAVCFAVAERVTAKATKTPHDKKTTHGKVTIAKVVKFIGRKLSYFQVTHIADGVYLTAKDLVHVLNDKDGTPESEHCYEIAGKGSSASDLIIKHASDVVLVFGEYKILLVDAIKQLRDSWQA